MAGLIVTNVITVVTQSGNCNIELYFGDISNLPLEEQVDVVVVSAFRGNYRPTPSSLIGSLKRNFGLDVGKLAQNKAEDLREIHHCWWSHRLPDALPFKRLLCFEAKHGNLCRPQELVGDVFRCLVPILNNQDGTVITPLLNTGDQGFSKTKMMRSMVEAAVNWMKAGLPLRKLKIVLYVHNVADKQRTRSRTELDACTLFEELKARYGMKELTQKTVPIEYDVYISSSEQDKELSTIIKDNLKSAKPDIRIFSNQQQLNKDQVWQEDMYEIMIRCARVITVISPQYLLSVSCMEQYNIALCCNRTAKRNILAPFYVEPIKTMPTYMCLVQYVDCLVNDFEKIGKACEQLTSTLDVKVHAEVVYEHPQLEYDVFISYCHRNADKAAEVMKIIKSLDPNLKVFFDTQELKTGSTWQQMLYHAIDGTKCFVAVITNEYLRSPVCQEEFNLSLSKHCQKSEKLTMVPLFLDDDLDDIPLEFKTIQLVRATGEFFIPAIEAACTAIVGHLRGNTTNMKSLFTKPDVSPDMQEIQEHLREAKVDVKYDLKQNWYRKSFPPDIADYFLKEQEQAIQKNVSYDGDAKVEGKKLHKTEEEHSDSITEHTVNKEENVKLIEGIDGHDMEAKNHIKHVIAISCTDHDVKYSKFFTKIIQNFAPNFVISCQSHSDQEQRATLDNASKIVVFISPSYTESHPHMEELNIALCRHRFSAQPVLFPIQLHLLPKHPSYLHLIAYRTCVIDQMWNEILKMSVLTDQLIIQTRKSCDTSQRISIAAAIALTVAAGDLVKEIHNESSSSDNSSPRSVLGNFAMFQAELKTLQSIPLEDISLSKMLLTIQLPIQRSKEECKEVERTKSSAQVQGQDAEKETGVSKEELENIQSIDDINTLDDEVEEQKNEQITRNQEQKDGLDERIQEDDMNINNSSSRNNFEDEDGESNDANIDRMKDTNIERMKDENINGMTDANFDRKKDVKIDKKTKYCRVL